MFRIVEEGFYKIHGIFGYVSDVFKNLRCQSGKALDEGGYGLEVVCYLIFDVFGEVGDCCWYVAFKYIADECTGSIFIIFQSLKDLARQVGYKTWRAGR